MECPKCGNNIYEGQKFCPKCGQVIKNETSCKITMPTPGMPKPGMSQRPGMPRPGMQQQSIMPKPGSPQQPGMPRPSMPQQPTMPKPGMPKPGIHQQPGIPTPGMPQKPQEKGFFTNAVRNVANVLTGGELNRQINTEQDAALLRQARELNGEIRQANQQAQDAVRAQARAERDAERAADRRSMEIVDGIDVVRGRAIWNIQPGEIARHIKESELEQIEKLKGIIIQEGCTALIYANGELVASLSSGAYLFYKSLEEEKAALKKAIDEAENQMSEAEKRKKDEQRRTQPGFRELGVFGEVGKAIGWVGRILFGEKKKGEQERKKRQIDYAKILSRLTQPPVLSVYIVSNRHIPMTFGGDLDINGIIDFKPYVIPMGIMNVEIAVSLDLEICDVRQIAVNYLSDKSRLTTIDVFNLLNKHIENHLRSRLRNVNYESTGLPYDLLENLRIEIQNLVDSRLHGLKCISVHSITDSNADFERFRNVERQLYNTEKEIDFMQRTGEFRNRMEIESNSQKIQSARTAEDLRYSLQQLNKDQILHDDELEAFVELTESQRRIRQATTAEDEQSAIEELRKNRLVREDEIEALEDSLAHKKIPREEITQLMRIQSQLNIDKTSQEAEWALDDARTNHDWEREDLERRRNWGIEDEEREREWMEEQRVYDRETGRRRNEDDYDFQQMLRERAVAKEDRLEARSWQIEDEDRAFERERVKFQDEDKIEANRHQRNLDKLQAMAQMQAQIDAQKYQHEENVANIHSNEQINRDNNFAQMSAEQIRAAQLSHLSEDAQIAMANSYSKDGELEAVKNAQASQQALMQQMMQMQQNNSAAQMDAMMKMAGMIKDTAASVSGSFQTVQQQQIDRLQMEKNHEQMRNEHLQDTTIDNISKVSTAAASNINAFNGGTHSPQPHSESQNASAEQVNMIECECYNCGHLIKIAYGTESCPECGAPFQW